jgi:3-oxo-5-alpha-steroid 4-dehydrogenase 1
MPLIICSSAVLFNFCNTFVIGYFLGNIGANYGNEYFFSFRFITGFLIFLTGVFINVKSDNMLINLRKPGETGYKIPTGFLFRYISCPNHFGEIIEWFGFAFMIGTMPAWSFAIWTFVNLVPRTLDHHRWYKQNFPNYPKVRKAVFPFIL